MPFNVNDSQLNPNGLIPWMNGRLDAGRNNSLPQNTTKSFGPTDDIVFKWIEDGTFTDYRIRIYAYGQWGAGGADHTALVVATSFLPVTPTHTVADRSTLFATIAANQGDTAYVTSEGTYWVAIRQYTYDTIYTWMRLVLKVNAGTVFAYGVNATIYTITVPQADIPKINDIPIIKGGYYSLCWEHNGIHAPRFDATFNIEPPGHLIYDEFFDRTELNSRIAGEKALFEDECLVAGQIEAGQGARIRWRKLDGSLSGYSTVAAKAGNLVIEGNALQAAHANGAIYFDESSDFIQFRDSSTVKFNVFKEVDTTVVKANVQDLPLDNRIWTKHWWVAANAANVPTFVTQNAQVVGNFNVLAGAISFSGHGFWDNTVSPPLPVYLGTGEIVAEHSGIIGAATPANGPGQIPPIIPTLLLPANNALSPQLQYLFEGVKILKTGCYLVHTVIQGLTSPFSPTANIPPHEHEMSLHYFVKRSGTYLNTYCLDHKNKFFNGYFDESELPSPGMYSNKWSLQGTAILALEEGDDLFGQVAAISYVSLPTIGGYSRYYTVNYITQHIEFMSERALTTNLYPHNNPWTVIQFFDFTAP